MSAPDEGCGDESSHVGKPTSRDTGWVERYERVRLTNPDKVLYPATGTTKAEVFDYYVAIADVMVPHIAGRPVTRKRWPNGVGEPAFFEKQLASSAPDWLQRGSITHKSGTTTYPIVDTREGLAWIAQQASLEVHVPQWRFAGGEAGAGDPHRVRPRSRRGRDHAPTVRGGPRGARISSATSA